MPSSKHPITNLLLKWWSSRGKGGFLTSRLSLRLKEALSHRSRSQELAWSNSGKIVRENPIFPTQRLYEILTIYFPAYLDQEATLSIKRIAGYPTVAMRIMKAKLIIRG
jgi:hypothetical protein